MGYRFGSSNRSSSSTKTKTSKSSSTFSSKGQIKYSGNNTTTSFSGCMNAIFQLFDLHHPFHFPNFHPEKPPAPPLPSSSILHLPADDKFVRLPHLQPPIYLKGVEAPRNSLEMEDTSFMKDPTTSISTMKLQETFKIPVSHIQMGDDIQIKTKSSRGMPDGQRLTSSESVNRSNSSNSSSPAGTSKTPTLVARLMGLDLLPETSSPRPSSSSPVSNFSSSKSQLNHHYQKITNTPQVKPKNVINQMRSRSLPNTPRPSSSRKADVVDQRVSLQISKENNTNDLLATNQEFEFSRFLTTKINAATDKNEGDEKMDPGHYAKEIVKQFKEDVIRRVGRDITNTLENRSEQRRDQHVVLLRSKKPPSSKLRDFHDHGQYTATDSCSPSLRLVEIKNMSHSPKLSASPLISPYTGTVQSKTATVKTSKYRVARSIPLKEEQKQQTMMMQSSPNQKCKRIESKKPCSTGALLKKPLVPRKKEESYVRPSSVTKNTGANANNLPQKKKCKQISFSNVHTILPVKIDTLPPSTRLPQQQEKKKQYNQLSKVFDNILLSKKGTGLPSSLSQSNKREHMRISTVTNVNFNGGTSTTVSAELIGYISRILECTGIREFTPVSFSKWYSPSHPLDPLLFHHIGLFFPQLEVNKERLVFDVVDELLAEILRPYMNLKPWVNQIARNDQIVLLYGKQLIDTLYMRIQNIPSLDCGVLEDFDALVNKDLSSERESSAFEEEGEGIVMDIEDDILDSLVHEIVVFIFRTQ